MSLFDPDDFADKPYYAGVNQGLHVAFGAALCYLFGPIIAVALFVGWELYQRYYKNSKRNDTIADIFFWSSGVFLFDAEYLSVAIISAAGLWMGVTWLSQK